MTLPGNLHVELERFSLPLSSPLETATGTIDTREGFLVRLRADDGDGEGCTDGDGDRSSAGHILGVGESTPLPGWTESLAECESALRSVVDPEDALDVTPDDSLDDDLEDALDVALDDDLEDALDVTLDDALDDALDVADLGQLDPRGQDKHDGKGGSVARRPAARHGVSLAVLDARAREAGEPLYRHLGGDRHVESVAVNATVGDGSPEETATAVAAAVDEGFPAVKVKVGARPLPDDLARLRAVRERAPAVELRADANGAWDRETAARALDALADLDVAYVEQPLPAVDLDGHAALCGRTGTAIAVDEGVIELGVDAVLDAGAADVIVCKPMALGGVDVAREVAIRAREAGVDPVVTTTVDGAVARAGAVHLAASLDLDLACGLATADRLEADLCADPAPVVDGAARVPHGKGNMPPS